MAFKLGSNTVFDSQARAAAPNYNAPPYSDNVNAGHIPFFKAVAYVDRVRVNDRIRFGTIKARPSNIGGVGVWAGLVVGGVRYASTDPYSPADTPQLNDYTQRFPFATAVKGSAPPVTLNAIRLDPAMLNNHYWSVGYSSQGYGITHRALAGVVPGSPPYPTNHTNSLHYVPFASDGELTQLGSLSNVREYGLADGKGAQSIDYGYKLYARQYANGIIYNFDVFPMSKFEFAVKSVGDCAEAYAEYTVVNGPEATHAVGGYTTPFTPPIPFPVRGTRTIKRHPFASILTVESHGSLLYPLPLRLAGGHSSPTYGYYSVGLASPAPAPTTIIPTVTGNFWKFPWASADTDIAAHGSIPLKVRSHQAHSSTTDAWISGGYGPLDDPPFPANTRNNIQRIPFSSDTASVDVGDLYQKTVSGAAFSG